MSDMLSNPNRYGVPSSNAFYTPRQWLSDCEWNHEIAMRLYEKLGGCTQMRDLAKARLEAARHLVNNPVRG